MATVERITLTRSEIRDKLDHDAREILGLDAETIRHLIAEHEITPISPSWEKTIEASEALLREVQRKRFLS